MKKHPENLPLVSIVIASFNSARYIEQTLKSVLGQTYTNFEIIVVDDESTDETLQIVQNAAARDSRIKVFKINHSGRPSVPRNFGIGKASGSIIAFLDSDDLWTRHKLEYQVNYLLRHSAVTFVYSMCFTFGDVNFFSTKFELLPLPFRAARNSAGLLKIGNTIPLSSVMIRKEALDESGGFDEDPDLKAVEDYDLWLRLSEKYIFDFVPRIQVYYRIHSSQSSAGWELQDKRLKILAQKRSIQLPEYKGIRRKGFLILLIRNTIHLKFYFLYKIIGFLDNGDRL